MWKSVRWVVAAGSAISIVQIASISQAVAVDPGVSLGVSWEHLRLPETEFAVEKRTVPGFSRDSVAKIENDDGRLNGIRFDFSAGGMAIGHGMQAGVKGFFSWHNGDTETQTCANQGAAVGDRYCTVVPLVDPNLNQFNMPFFVVQQNVAFQSEKDVRHWGVALELDSARNSPFGWKGGFAYRTIDQDFDLTARADGLDSAVRVSYSEDLQTHYWGGYVGAVAKQSYGGLTIALDGEVGLYWANTDYEGTYSAQNTAVSPALNQTLQLDDDKLAAIVAVKLSAEQNMGAFLLSGFVRGEYISYAPQVRYNDTDRNTAAFPNSGLNNGTSLDDDNAWSFSAGARVRVPLQQQ